MIATPCGAVVLWVLLVSSSLYYADAKVDPSACVKAHNDKRALHVATAPLVWDETLAKDAEQWAEHLLQTDQLTHSDLNQRNGAGENLFFSISPAVSTCAEAADQWYSEAGNYPFEQPPTSIFGGKDGKVIGHFTQLGGVYSMMSDTPGSSVQVVWKSTKRVGVARASKRHPNGLWETYVVARYSPASQLRAKFANEVGRSQSVKRR